MTPPITALGSRYGIQGALGRSVKRAAAGGGWWDLNGTITSCIAAYQPKGAASYAASLTDLSGNSNDLTEVDGSLAWGVSTGWVGASQISALDTGISGLEPTKFTIIGRFDNGSETAGYLFGWMEQTPGRIAAIPNYANAYLRWWNGYYELNVTGGHINSGVLAISGTSIYVDGTPVESGGTAGYNCGNIYIMGTNAVSFAKFSGNGQAFAIYSTVLTSTQISDLSTAMNAL